MSFLKSIGNSSEHLGKYWVSHQFKSTDLADGRADFLEERARCQHWAVLVPQNSSFILDSTAGLTDTSDIIPPPLRLPSGDAQPRGGVFFALYKLAPFKFCLATLSLEGVI